MIIFKVLLLLSISSMAYANNWFQNSEQQGKIAFDQKNYAEAVKLFNDSYKRGVALYQDGQYVAAAEEFAKVDNPKINLDAQYNLGNSYFQQKEYKKAVQAYEQVLKNQPNHDDAKSNLELAKQQLKKSEESKPSEDSDQSKPSEDSEQSKPSEDSEQSKPSEDSDQSKPSEDSDQSKPSEDSDQSKSSKDSEQSQTDSQSQQEDMEENLTSTENSDEPDESEQTAASSAIVKESDMMADALLERINENTKQLLRGQFYIDAQKSKQRPPDKPW